MLMDTTVDPRVKPEDDGGWGGQKASHASGLFPGGCVRLHT